jgi:hypothetical protein
VSKAEIDQFAINHTTNAIIALLFPGGIAANTVGQSGNQVISSLKASDPVH